MGKPRIKPNYRRRVLRLPDLDHCKIAVLNSLGSPASRRVYEYAIDQFIAWYCSEPRLAFNRIVVVRYRMYLESRHLAANTINQQLAAVRRLAHEAAGAGLLSPELAAGISRVKGVKQLGFRVGNWLSAEQSAEVLQHAWGDSVRAKRDYAMLALLFGCGFRRSELVGMELDEIQMRQGHWAVVDLIGKGGHIRTVPIPQWVKAALDQWIRAAGVTDGRIFRAVARAGKVWGKGISQNVVWYVVKTCCERAGLEHIAPHDLRRTCAKLCHTSGGELEQIQFLLGHASGLGLVANASNVPFYLWVGDEDKERKSSFENFRTALTAVGNPPTVVVAAGVGHNYRTEDAVALESWLLQHTRQMPKHFSFIVDTPQHRGIWGVSIPRVYPDAYPQAEPRVKFECWIEGSTIRIRTWDAKQIEVNLGPTGLKLSGNVRLIVDGKTRFTGVAPAKPLSLSLSSVAAARE